ncbi:hypothetical protein MKW94_020745 [Papaver nudicaule]|uniref:Uncharacterized protein n=1 Tax=Papaver nudicaule TaxID=74823 RepID=A0AA41SH90_PAPNU|nr:hypothetical protein [Papaver nudicaule]
MNTEILDAEQNVAIQITEEIRVLANSIELKLESISSSTIDCSIYRVHEKFRKQNESAYTPEMISIGPFHRGKKSLAPMEDQKLRYTKALLSRTMLTGQNKVKECVAYLKEIEEVARKCYSEHINLSSDEFVEMMVIDGLFMIELLRKKADKTVKFEPGDPFFSKTLGLSSLVRDLLLLENQLPMIVLECLLNVPGLKGELKGVPINILVLRFFNPWIPLGKEVIESSFSSHKGKHILDLLSQAFCVLLPKVGNKKIDSGKPIRSVIELKNAGVKFVKSSTSGSFLDIRFKDGIMEIPPIDIEDQSDTLLRNFIAFEQCCDGQITYMTSYAFFIDSLINSGQDVGVLCKQGIITNLLGDDEAVAVLFNKLCCEVTLANFYYSELCDQVNTYYNTRWHVWRATLKRDYFNSPWAILSFMAAVVLLVLTFLATLYAILSYDYQTKHGTEATPPSYKS